MMRRRIIIRCLILGYVGTLLALLLAYDDVLAAVAG